MIRTRKLRKDAASDGKTFDDIMAEHEEHGIPFKFAERKFSKWNREKPNDVEVGVTRDDGELRNETEQPLDARHTDEHAPTLETEAKEKNP